MILGIIGGIIGIVIAIMAIGAGAVIDLATQAVTADGEIPRELQDMTASVASVGRLALGGGIGILIASIIGLIGAAMVNKNQKISGILMLIGGIVGFVLLSMGFIVPGILLIIGGALALTAKEEVKA